MKRPLFVALVLLLSFEANAATTMYSQPPIPNGSTLFQSSGNGNDYDKFVWDNLTLSSAQDITEIAWRGGYDLTIAGAGYSGPVLDFSVAIWGSIGAGTQPDIGSGALVLYDSIGGNGGETLVGQFGMAKMYDYAYVLPTPFHAEAGRKYWVTIQAFQSGVPDWGVAAATGGDGHYFGSFVNYAGGTAYAIYSGDAAFTLLGTAGTTFTITTSASPANGGTTSGGGTRPGATSATVVATPNPGYAFVNWTENGAPVSSLARYSFIVTANRTLVAHFAPAFTITTGASPGNGGLTTGDGPCASGTIATVVATPSTGYEFVNWTENGVPVSTSARYSFTVHADRTLVANFTLNSAIVTFDFDTGAPTLTAGQNIPLDQMAGGVTAHFSPGAGSGGFSVQSDASTQYRLSHFSGNYLYPNSLGPNILDIQFNQPLSSITLAFCTADFQQVEVPTTIQLTAYNGSTGTPAVGEATAHGIYASDTMPMGTLSFASGSMPFNLVEIRIAPNQPQGASVFLVDNITVTLRRRAAVRSWMAYF